MNCITNAKEYLENISLDDLNKMNEEEFVKFKQAVNIASSCMLFLEVGSKLHLETITKYPF